MKRYEVEVFIDGNPTYMMDVPASTPEKSERYARVWTMKLHPQTDLDLISARATGNFEEFDRG